MNVLELAPIDPATTRVGVGYDGYAVTVKADGPHPSVDGYTVEALRMTRSTPHGGEPHPDGDEVLHLVTGRVDVLLESSAEEHGVGLEDGQAFVIPRDVWHRRSTHLAHVTPGPGAEYRSLEIPNEQT